MKQNIQFIKKNKLQTWEKHDTFEAFEQELF